MKGKEQSLGLDNLKTNLLIGLIVILIAAEFYQTASQIHDPVSVEATTVSQVRQTATAVAKDPESFNIDMRIQASTILLPKNSPDGYCSGVMLDVHWVDLDDGSETNYAVQSIFSTVTHCLTDNGKYSIDSDILPSVPVDIIDTLTLEASPNWNEDYPVLVKTLSPPYSWEFLSAYVHGLTLAGSDVYAQGDEVTICGHPDATAGDSLYCNTTLIKDDWLENRMYLEPVVINSGMSGGPVGQNGILFGTIKSNSRYTNAPWAVFAPYPNDAQQQLEEFTNQ